MFKKIALSVGVIVFVGAAAAGATGAFFSDNETSTANTFAAGAIDLKVDDVQHYDGLVCTLNTQTTEVTTDYWWQPDGSPLIRPELVGTPCTGTWTLTDLGPTNQFFNYTDVKPGDIGENTVSLHVDNNPAYACAYIRTTSDLDNTYTQPEINAGDLSSTTGELAQNISLFAWLDTASTSGATTGDNIWQAGEPILQNVTALSDLSGTTTLTLADSGTGSALPGGSTSYIGMGWCAGTLTIGAPGTWACDGSSMSNQAQTDSATADVTFHVEQQRNNGTFLCQPPVVVAPTTGGLTVTKAFSGADPSPELASTFTIHVKTLGNVDAVGALPASLTGTNFSGLTAGTYVVTEDPVLGFTPTFSAGCGATTTPVSGGATLITAGATSTCTITNTFTPVINLDNLPG